MHKIKLALWALRHDLNPSLLVRRMGAIINAYTRILCTSVTYLVVSSFMLLTLPFVPFHVAVMAVYHSLVHTKNVQALRDTIEKHAQQSRKK